SEILDENALKMRAPKRRSSANTASPGRRNKAKRKNSTPIASHTVAIVGLGYVGLPLALQFARSGAKVIGLDIDKRKTDTLQKGGSYIEHIPAARILQELEAKRFSATTDFSVIREV